MKEFRVRLRPKLRVTEGRLPVKDETFQEFARTVIENGEDYGVKSFGIVVEHVDGSQTNGFSIGHDGSRVKLLGSCVRLIHALNKELDKGEP